MTAGARAAELFGRADLIEPMAIRVAASLWLADHVAGGAGDVASLARLTGVDAGALERLLRYLVAAGIFAAEGGGYRLTERGALLRSGHPSGLRESLTVDGAHGRAELCLVDLLHCVRTGQAAYPVRYGRSFWQDVADRAELSESFDATMAVKVASVAAAVVVGYDWGSLGHLVDVGGGNGALCAVLLSAHPGLRATIVEQPAPARAAAKNLAQLGLADRGEVVTGSFFEPLPAGADGYLLCDVLHDWDDEHAVQILDRCARAAGELGRVLVVERSDLDRRGGAGMDLRMLAWFGGRQRDAAQIGALGDAVGLGVAGVHPAGVMSVIELRAALS
ncbi:methyltransferase [Actinomadura gamaensis]|uniref:Methyltransferase n=1 Tax=Actinomadura gamaensis TaxID=1763541 RepID=A0ABV9UBL1_9ACTN